MYNFSYIIMCVELVEILQKLFSYFLVIIIIIVVFQYAMEDNQWSA